MEKHKFGALNFLKSPWKSPRGGGNLLVLPKIRHVFIYCHYNMLSVSFHLLVNTFTN